MSGLFYLQEACRVQNELLRANGLGVCRRHRQVCDGRALGQVQQNIRDRLGRWFVQGSIRRNAATATDATPCREYSELDPRRVEGVVKLGLRDRWNCADWLVTIRPLFGALR